MQWFLVVFFVYHLETLNQASYSSCFQAYANSVLSWCMTFVVHRSGCFVSFSRVQIEHICFWSALCANLDPLSFVRVATGVEMRQCIADWRHPWSDRRLDCSQVLTVGCYSTFTHFCCYLMDSTYWSHVDYDLLNLSHLCTDFSIFGSSRNLDSYQLQSSTSESQSKQFLWTPSTNYDKYTTVDSWTFPVSVGLKTPRYWPCFASCSCCSARFIGYSWSGRVSFDCLRTSQS